MDKTELIFGLIGLVFLATIFATFFGLLGQTKDAVFISIIIGCFAGAAWAIGAMEGRRLKREARDLEKESQNKIKQSEAEIKRAREIAKRAKDAVTQAEQVQTIAKLKALDDDDKAIRSIRDYPTARKVEFGLRAGKFAGDSEKEFQGRCDQIVSDREKKWRNSQRYGHDLLQVVERQNGLCGDPVRDPSCKGCGCYLFGLPPTAVHLDHIVPKALGGQDDLENMQALCSACNINSGAKLG